MISTALNPASVPASPFYSQGIEIRDAGRLVFVSGQVGMTADGQILPGIESQAAQAVANLNAVLDEAGLSALVETVAAATGRVAALVAGELPHDLVEQADEAGAERVVVQSLTLFEQPAHRDNESRCAESALRALAADHRVLNGI